MSDAEIMTTALVATHFFGANFETARDFLQTYGYIPNMLSKSRFNRRLHRIKPMIITLFEILEDSLAEAGVELKPIRKKNSKRRYPPWEAYLVNYYCKSVEATASLIERLLPRSIHAVTPQGFELKVVLFVVATNMNQLRIYSYNRNPMNR